MNLRRERVFASLVVLLAPSNALSLMLGLLFGFFSSRRRDWQNALALSLALFMASYNSTKAPEADLQNYLHYSELLTDTDLSGALTFANEPIYYLLNWLHVAFLGFNFSSWIFVVTFLIYYVALHAYHVFAKENLLPARLSLAIIVFFGFFPLVFAQSGHLIRQYLAASLGLLGLVRYISTGRWNVFLLLAPFAHVSAAIFLFVPIVGKISVRAPRSGAVLGIVIPILLIGGARHLAGNISLLGAIGVPGIVVYGLSRLGQGEFHTITSFGSLGYAFVVSSILLAILCLVGGVARKTSISVDISHRTNILFSFQFVLALTSLSLSLLGLTEPAVRFVQYLYFLVPISLGYLACTSHLAKWMLIGLAAVMPVLFFIYPSPWTYRALGEVLLLPHHAFMLEGVLF